MDSTALQSASTALRTAERPVEAWLANAPERKRAAILNYAAGERSIVLSFLYASLLGMEVSIDDWEAFVLSRWKKLDHRAILESEVMALHKDIAEIREAVETGRMRQGDAPTKLAYLSRELRGHMEHMSKELMMHDRRSLLLAGVEVAGKYLKKTLGTDTRTWPVIEASLEAAWTDLEEKNSG